MNIITIVLAIALFLAASYLYSHEEQDKRDEESKQLEYYSPNKGKRRITVRSYSRMV